jgi:putative DNA primase/helicase
MLAFWAGKDADQVDRLFRGSDLMRDKWDSARGGSTYGRLTIEKAIANTSRVYCGRR